MPPDLHRAPAHAPTAGPAPTPGAPLCPLVGLPGPNCADPTMGLPRPHPRPEGSAVVIRPQPCPRAALASPLPQHSPPHPQQLRQTQTQDSGAQGGSSWSLWPQHSPNLSLRKPGSICRVGPNPLPHNSPQAEGPGPPTFLITSTPRAELGPGTCVAPIRCPAWCGGREGVSKTGRGREGRSIGRGAGMQATPTGRRLCASPLCALCPWHAGAGGQLPQGEASGGRGGHWSLTTSLSPLSALSSWLLVSL